MNKNLVGFDILLLFLIVTPCFASHSQGLEWKYGEGVRYDFHEVFYLGDNETPSLVHDWTYYLIAPNYTELSDPLASWYIPTKHALTYWPNGTEMQTGPMPFAVPVGNWSILSTIIESMSDENVTFSAFESNDVWGYEEERSADISSSLHREEFSKPNGVLTKLTDESTILNHHSVYVIERLAISPGVIQLGITLVAAVSIVSILLVYHRLKK